MMFILLTGEQADNIRGPSASRPSSVLEPIERQGNVFILGANVLEDSAHEAHWEYLETLPQLDEDDPLFPSEMNADEEEFESVDFTDRD